MQNASIPTAPKSRSKGAKTTSGTRAESGGYPVSPRTLVTLDFGLFRALRSLGTSRERICSALRISDSDFEYISELAGV